MAVNFVAIDFEIANSKRSSICEVGVCVVRDGKVVETRSWLVQPEDNCYWWRLTHIHGIRPKDTEHAPTFPEVWSEIERLYCDEFDTFVAHSSAFDKGCLESAAQLYNIHLPELKWLCSCQTARRVYDFECNTLDYLCKRLDIPEGTHHRAGDDAEMCARLYLRELEDMNAKGNPDL